MSTTPDLAPDRPRRTRRPATPRTSQELESQVKSLQDDIKGIAATLARLSNEKVSEARSTATREYHQVVEAGQQVLEGVGDQATAMEKHLKATIREKPLTAVATAVGVGFVLALLTR